MAEKLQNLATKTGQTFEQAFKESTGDVIKYSELIDELVEKYSKLQEFDEDRKDSLEKYLTGLQDINEQWEDANRYAEELSSVLSNYVYDVTGIRNIFNEIVSSIRGTRSEANERLRSLTRIRDIARDINEITEVRGMSDERSLNTLEKRVGKAVDNYRVEVQYLLGSKQLYENGELNVKALQEAKNLQESRLRFQEKELKLAKQLNNRDKIRALNEEIRLRRANLELLNEENFKRATTDVQGAFDLRKQTLRDTRKKYFGPGLIANLAEKAGIVGSKEIYDNYVQDYSSRKIDLEQAKNNLKQVELKNKATLKDVGVLEESPGKFKDSKTRLYISHNDIRVAKYKELADAQAAVAGAENNLNSFRKTRVGLVKDIAKNAWECLSPQMIAVGLAIKIWNNFKLVSEEAANIKQIVGSWTMGAAATNNAFATSVDWLKAAKELASEIKINPISLFTPDEIGRMAEAKNLLGLTDQQAGKLAVQSKLNAQSSDEYRKNLTKGINEGNGLNKTAIALGTATREALNASNAITISMGNNAEKIGKAAVAAQAMGLSLQEVENISKSLINFESSISAEMEAQLLTGKNLNLQKAREYALNNDLEGVARELQNQGITMAEYGRMNVIQQESLAKALGMTREQYSQMLIQRYLSNDLSKEELKAATKMTDEQIEALSVSEQWRVATQKLTQAFTPLLEAIIPIVELISNLISKIAGAIGFLTSFGKKASEVGVKGVDRTTTQGSQKIGSPQWFRGNREDWEGLPVGEKRLARRAARKVRRGKDVSSEISELPEAVQASIVSLKDLGKEGDSAFTKILGGVKGFLATSLLLGVAFPKLAAASASMFKSMISGLGRTVSGFVNLGKAVAHPGKAFKRIGQVIQNSWRQGRTGGQQVVSGAKGIGDLGKAANNVPAGSSKKLDSFGNGIRRFFNRIRAIPMAAIGKVALIAGIVTGAAIGIGFALKLAAPAIEAFGKAIKSVFEGIATVLTTTVGAITDAFVTLGNMKLANIGKATLGMLGLSVGVGALGAALFLAGPRLRRLDHITNFLRTSESLSVAAQSVRNLAVAITSLGNSLDTLNTEKFKDLEDIKVGKITRKVEKLEKSGALTSLMTSPKPAGTPVQASNSNDSNSSSNSKEIERKLESIKEFLAGGQTIEVNIDGYKVGKTLVLASSRMG